MITAVSAQTECSQTVKRRTHRCECVADSELSLVERAFLTMGSIRRILGRIRLSRPVRTLDWFISTGERKSEDNTRARILLKVDDGLTDAEISEHVGCHPKTVFNTRKAYAERGLAAIHRRKPDREYETKLDGRAEAHLIRLACSEPPEGHARWSLHLLADELVTLDEIDFNQMFGMCISNWRTAVRALMV